MFRIGVENELSLVLNHIGSLGNTCVSSSHNFCQAGIKNLMSLLKVIATTWYEATEEQNPRCHCSI